VELQNRITFETNEMQVGKSFEVLVEGPSKRDITVATTRTRGNRLVHVAGEWEPGEMITVAITRAAPHYLEGRLVS
jgi:tRNA-2-methylthio-N6-dimethylallyladenosine synthase